MIQSTKIKINKIENFDNLYIENELKKLGFELIRWAVIAVDDESLTVSVSYSSKNI